jgi:hypothetical protein
MRDVKLEYAQGWKKSRISKREPGYYNECTVSVLQNVPDNVSDKEIITRWDNVCLTKVGELRYVFHYYELIDAETTAKEDYRVNEYNKGAWCKKKK